MRPKLYMTEESPAVRAVLLTAKYLEVTLELKQVDLRNKEQLSEGYLKLNPQHTVPTLEDNGYVIWDSHAIIAYLVGKFGKDDSLYPKDFQKRATIDQRLHFDSGILTCFTRNIFNPMLYDGVKVDHKKRLEHIENTYGILEQFFGDNDWIAGATLNIADLSLLPSVTSLDIIAPINEKKYPKLTQWIKKAENEPFYVANQNGLNKFRYLVCSCQGLTV